MSLTSVSHKLSESQILDYILLLLQGYQQGAGTEVDQPGFELAPTYDANIVGGTLIHNTTAALQPVFFLLLLLIVSVILNFVKQPVLLFQLKISKINIVYVF